MSGGAKVEVGASRKDSNGRTLCPLCGEELACGARAGSETCWCFDLPPVPPEAIPAEAADQCLCPACLRRVAGQAEQE